jgi:hypothetical protein
MRSEFFFPTIANREKRTMYRTDDTALARANAAPVAVDARAHPNRAFFFKLTQVKSEHSIPGGQSP